MLDGYSSKIGKNKMQKMSMQELKDLFSFRAIQTVTQSAVNPFIRRPSFRGGKHAASKKGHKHVHRLSKGQLNHPRKEEAMVE